MAAGRRPKIIKKEKATYKYKVMEAIFLHYFLNKGWRLQLTRTLAFCSTKWHQITLLHGLHIWELLKKPLIAATMEANYPSCLLQDKQAIHELRQT